ALNDGAFLWDVDTGARLLVMKHESESTGSAVFSPDGQRAAVASTGGVRFWELTPGKEVGLSLQLGAMANGLVFSADGHRVLTSTPESSQVWDATAGTALSPVLKHSNPVPTVNRDASLSPDAQWVATASNERSVRVWDAATGEPASP